jgi:glycerol-3-phosphate O-acyltransferase
MLAYYRNNLIHNFVNESLIANSILGVSNIQSISQGISVNLLWEKVAFLRDLLENEFIVRKDIQT